MGDGLPQAMPGISNVLLDLSLLPTCCRVTELRLKKIMAGHCRKTRVDGSRLATAYLVHGGAHIIVNAALWHAAKYSEGVVMGIE